MRTFAIHDILKQFAEGKFDSSNEMIGSLNGPMSRLCTEIESAIQADDNDEIKDLEQQVADLHAVIGAGSDVGDVPCPRCGGDYPNKPKKYHDKKM